MFIYPSAHAHLEPYNDLVSSDRESDLGHGITLIGDGTPPECLVSVNGSSYEKLAYCDISNVSTGYVVDRRYRDVNIDLYVSDSGSGLKDEFYVRVINLDNGLEGSYTGTGEHLYLNLKQDPDSEEPLFDNMLFTIAATTSAQTRIRIANTRLPKPSIILSSSSFR